jgi:hypothetical protein
MSQLDWIKQSDRDVYAYIAHLKPLLAARWNANWVEGHVGDRKKQKKNWTFDESCNAINHCGTMGPNE